MSKTTSSKKLFVDEMTKVIGEPDRYGHFKFEGRNGTPYRVKIGDISWRIERRVVDRWVKSIGEYFTSEKSAMSATSFITTFNKKND